MIETEQRFEIDYIDQSGLSACSRCPAKYLFSRLMGLTLPGSDTIAIDYGTDMHLAFPHCYEEDVSCVERAATIFRDSWTARGYGIDDKRRNPARARASLAEFHRLHKPSICPYQIIKPPEEAKAVVEGIGENELPFVVDIGGDLLFAGRIDLLVRMNETGRLWGDDYKTASEVSARYFNNFENSPQAVGYTLATSAIMRERVEGMIVEAVRVSPSNDECQMYHVFVNDQQIDLFKEHANNIAHLILNYNITGRWPQNTSACAPYPQFGQPGRFCEYKDLCTVGDWREMAKYYKKSKPFHPFKMEK